MFPVLVYNQSQCKHHHYHYSQNQKQQQQQQQQQHDDDDDNNEQIYEEHQTLLGITLYPAQQYFLNRSKCKSNNIVKGSMIFLLQIILLMVLSLNCEATVHQVLTYKNASTSLGQLVTSSTLIWETYDNKDSKQLQYAVEGGKYITKDEHYPIYVCRVTIDGVATSGHTEKIHQTHLCVAAHYKNNKYKNFDVLINKGHLGKLSWRPWRKFNAGVPVGAIRIGTLEDTYIARHKVMHSQVDQSNDQDYWGADYNLGRLDTVGLGKIKVMEENHGEKDYDDGEVLVETEPYRYELRDINLDQIRLDMRINQTDLASAILENREEKYNLVETVLSYTFNYIQYWGSHEGVARGLPTKVFEQDNQDEPAEINWGLKHVAKKSETKSVNTKLWPGTAINVTLKGNYVTLEAPYTAKLYAFYYGSEESVSRKITSEVRKSYLKDVKLEFSPVYWIENGTVLPTLLAASTTSSTTTLATTTSTGQPLPLHEPPIVEMKNMGPIHSGPDSLEKSILDSSADLPTDNNEIIYHSKPENFAEKHQKPALAGIASRGCSITSATITTTTTTTTAIITAAIITATVQMKLQWIICMCVAIRQLLSKI